MFQSSHQTQEAYRKQKEKKKNLRQRSKLCSKAPHQTQEAYKKNKREKKNLRQRSKLCSKASTKHKKHIKKQKKKKKKKWDKGINYVPKLSPETRSISKKERESKPGAKE